MVLPNFKNMPKLKLKRATSCPTASLTRAQSNESAVTVSSSGSDKKARAKGSRAKRTTSRKVGTDKCDIVKLYLNRFNNREMEDVRAMFTDSCTCKFPNDCEMAIDEVYTAALNMVEALPDFKFTTRLIEEVVLESGKSFVVVHDLLAQGTHTGAPFAIGPYPEVEPSGKFVKNDPETVRFHFDKDGKICRVKIIKSGVFSGPGGLYTQLGGIPLM